MTSRSPVDGPVAVVPGIRTCGRSGEEPTPLQDAARFHEALAGAGYGAVGGPRATAPLGIPGHGRVAGNAAVRTRDGLGGGRCPAGPHRVRAGTGNAGHLVMTALVRVRESGAGDDE
ncbi:hypothetical protein ACFVFH_01805 [Streptomyces sp. NPDC057697]|uniref:hypothetical protein n=1 Tax=Streptomyces sp. NPDC057697 TaxID=3346219 RepID=UPI0036B53E92